MSKRVTLTDDDRILLVKLLEDVDTAYGFNHVAVGQRVDSILAKLGPKTRSAIKLKGAEVSTDE